MCIKYRLVVGTSDPSERKNVTRCCMPFCPPTSTTERSSRAGRNASAAPARPRV